MRAAFKTVCSFEIHEASPRFSAIMGSDGGIIGFKNIEQLSDHSVAENIAIFRRLKQNYPTKLILASIMGQNDAEWEELARLCEKNGADGIAAINTIKSVIGVNPHTYVSEPAVRGRSAVGGYSGNAVKPIALRFIAELGQNPALRGMHLSAMGGIETWRDALEFILLGACSVQVTTAVMQYGYRIIDDLKTGLNLYLAEKGFNSIQEAVGLALDAISDTTDVLERDTVIFPRFLREKCIGCGRCAISCGDGGHQAIKLDENRRPKLNGQKCVGCHLCILVCLQRAITPGIKRIQRK